jgi:hypothetical protein
VFYRVHHKWDVTPDELSVQSTIKQKRGCRAPGAAGHRVPGFPMLEPLALADEIVSVRRELKVIMFPDLQFGEIVNYYFLQQAGFARYAGQTKKQALT